MRTIISFSSKSIKAVQGIYDGKKFHIAECCTVDMPKNSFANMTVMEDKKEDVLSALAETRGKLKKCKSCEIVLDNPLCVTAELQWLGAKGFERVAQNAFLYRKDFDEQNYVTDYMVLEKGTEDQPLLLLFGAVRRDVISGFLSLFKEAGLVITRADMSMAGILKFTAKSINFKRTQVLINMVDGDVLTVCSFRENGAMFTARTLINEKECTESYYDHIAREVYNHAKYKKTDRSGGSGERNHMYLYDMNEQSDTDTCMKALKANASTEDYCSIGVRAALSDNLFDSNVYLDPYVALIGAMIG